MVDEVTLPGGCLISDDRDRLDMDFIHQALSGTDWAADHPRALTERCWAHCLGFGVYDPDGSQVGCARVLTDYTFRAHLGDLVIRPDRRGLGLGKALVDRILRHPDLVTVSHWTLTTVDAHALYARHGFRTGEAGGTWMTLVREPASIPGGAP